jgi:hypothetical protein
MALRPARVDLEPEPFGDLRAMEPVDQLRALNELAFPFLAARIVVTWTRSALDLLIVYECRNAGTSFDLLRVTGAPNVPIEEKPACDFFR